MEARGIWSPGAAPLRTNAIRIPRVSAIPSPGKPGHGGCGDHGRYWRPASGSNIRYWTRGGGSPRDSHVHAKSSRSQKSLCFWRRIPDLVSQAACRRADERLDAPRGVRLTSALAALHAAGSGSRRHAAVCARQVRVGYSCSQCATSSASAARPIRCPLIHCARLLIRVNRRIIL